MAKLIRQNASKSSSMWRLLLFVSVARAWQQYVPPPQRQVQYTSMNDDFDSSSSPPPPPTTMDSSPRTNKRTFHSRSIASDQGVHVFSDLTIEESSSSDTIHGKGPQMVLRRLFDQFIGANSEDGPDANSGGGGDDPHQDTTGSTKNHPQDGANGNSTVDGVSEFLDEVIDTTYDNGTASSSNSSSVYTRSNSTVYSQYQPLRIRAILTDDNSNSSLLSSSERDYLFQELLSPALIAWSQALRVDPVAGNLTVDPLQLSDGETCGPGKDSGLPSIPVPSDHFTIGVPDTDLIIYLSLGVTASTTEDEEDATSIQDDGSGQPLLPFNSKGRKGERGDSDSQQFYDTSNSTNITSPICNGDFLAASSFCSTDQFDRPTAAMLHICLTPDFFDPASKRVNIVTFMHEIGHALGFNELSMAYFRRPDGTPLTPRGPNGEVPLEEVECTGPSGHRHNATIPLPSSNTVQFRSVRRGVRVAEIVTPSVVQVVRNQFDCQQLTGAELESGEALPLSGVSNTCLGDHWERRLFSTDIMNPIVGDLELVSRISTLTLAYFADSGWYQVDLARSDVAASWGRSAGCSFVDEPCIGSNGQVAPDNEPYFCNEVPTEYSRSLADEIHGCTPDLTRKALCSIGEYDSALPFEYQYFLSTLGSDIGGEDPFMDYCPVYTGFSNGLCSSEETGILLQASPLERFGERNSRCLLGQTSGFEQKTALCMPIACVAEDRSLHVKIDGRWKECRETGEQLKTSDPNRNVICPDLRRVCPTFYCSYDCLGTEGGICDYNSGKCLCPKEEEHYEGHNSGVVYSVCFSEEESEDGGYTKQEKSPFLRPVPGNDDPHMPDPDSPLADYYVARTKDLEDDEWSLLETWMIGLVSAAGVVTAMIVIYIAVKRRRGGDDWDWFINSNEGPGDNDPGIVVDPHLQKQKGVAHALWELRIQHPQLQLDEETDCHLTESDVARSSLASQYSRQSSEAEISSSDIDLNTSQIESIGDPEEVGGGIVDLNLSSSSPPSSPPHAVIRRRAAGAATWNDPYQNEF